MTRTGDSFAQPLRRLVAGEIPPNVAVMQLLAAADDPQQVRAALAHATDEADAHERARLALAVRLLDDHPQAFGVIRRVLSHMNHSREIAAPATLAGDYDRLLEVSPEAAVALYSLGDPGLLQAATLEVVERMRGWGLLGGGREALEVGCGTGRFLRALAPELRRIVGLDISSGMVDAAQAAAADLANVEVRLSAGRDLADFAAQSFDLVFAVDSFPYLVQACVAQAHLEEIARVLRPGGDLLILNYSYRGSVQLDEADLMRIAPPLGLLPVRRPAPGFAYWDAASFTLRRRP